MNYYDIQIQKVDHAELNQRNREEDHMREVGILPTYKTQSYEPSQKAWDAVKVLCKQLFRNEVQNA